MNENYSAGHSPAGGGQPPRPSVPPQQPRRGFFDTIRTSGHLRAEPRVVGGVLSGLSYKYGWDPTLLRVLMVIATLFFPLLASAYAVAWALLPEQRDGRIHAEALTLGYFDIAQLGIGALFLLGLGNSAMWTSFTLGLEPIVILFLAIPIVTIVGIVAIIQAGKPKNTWQAPQAPHTPQHPHAPQAPHAPGAPTPGMQTPGAPYAGPSTTGAPFAPASPSTPSGPTPTTGPHTTATAHEAPAADWRTQGGPQPATAPQPHAYSTPATPTGMPPAGYGAAAASYHMPPQAAPLPPRPLPPRGIPLWANLLITGIVILIITGVFAMLTLPEFAYLSVFGAGQAILIGGGICLLLVALPMMIAALRGRTAHWLVALSIFGIFLAMPTTMAGVAMTNDWGNTLRFPHATTIPHLHYGSDTVSIGSVQNATWDLADLPNGDTTHYQADEILGELVILVRQGQPIEIRVQNAIGLISAEYQEGSRPWVAESFGLQVGTSMRSVTDPQQKVTTVDIDGVLGALTIIEVAPDTTTPPAEPPAVEAPPAANTPQSTTTRDSEQSGAGSANAPQSATR